MLKKKNVFLIFVKWRINQNALQNIILRRTIWKLYKCSLYSFGNCLIVIGILIGNPFHVENYSYDRWV